MAAHGVSVVWARRGDGGGPCRLEVRMQTVTQLEHGSALRRHRATQVERHAQRQSESSMVNIRLLARPTLHASIPLIRREIDGLPQFDPVIFTIKNPSKPPIPILLDFANLLNPLSL